MSTWLVSPETNALGAQVMRVLDQLPVGVLVVDLSGAPLYCNAKAMALIGDGVGRDVDLEALGDFFGARVAGTSEPYPVAKYAEILFGGEAVTIDDVEMDGPDGPLRIEIRAAPILAHDGQVAYAIITFRDVTAQQTAQEAVERSQEKFRSLVQEASDLLAVCAEDGTLLYITPSLTRILGYDPDDVIGITSPEVMHPDDLPLVVDAFARARVQRRADIEFRARHRNGSWRWLEFVVTDLLDDPSVSGFVINGRDVTERKDAEAAVRASEERWKALLQNSSDVVTVIDGDGSIRYSSPSNGRAFGYRDLTTHGLTFADLVDPNDLDRVGRIFARVLETPGVSEPIEVRVLHEDGSTRWVEAVANNMLDDPLVAGIVVNTRDVTERKRAEEQLARLALYDSLTGLANRALLLDHLEQALAQVRRTRSLAAVLFLDLDHFKVINDGLGHAAGDELLVQVASRIKTVLRDGDTAARIGGDEFVLCCENLHDREEALVIAERVATVLGETLVIDGHEIAVTASVGITFVADGGRAADEVLRDADTAMYRAKDHGRARYEVFDASIRRRALARLDEHLDLRRALATRQFRLTYQPMVAVEQGEVVGTEVLLRWAHPRRGLVPPSEFIPVAEETGAIVPLGAWVLAEGCREVAAWNWGLDARPPLNVSVNLSARQLADCRLPDLVSAALVESGLDPSLLWLEITESVLMDDAGAAVGSLKDLKSLGVRLAIDDFGTGYSSLAYLKRFPVDMLKIDRCFVAGLEDEAENLAIVSAVVGLGKTLGLTVVAEGVETSGQLRVLNDLGCDLAQGFYFSEAVPPQHLEDLLDRRVSW